MRKEEDKGSVSSGSLFYFLQMMSDKKTDKLFGYTFTGLTTDEFVGIGEYQNFDIPSYAPSMFDEQELHVIGSEYTKRFRDKVFENKSRY